MGGGWVFYPWATTWPNVSWFSNCNIYGRIERKSRISHSPVWFSTIHLTSVLLFPSHKIRTVTPTFIRTKNSAAYIWTPYREMFSFVDIPPNKQIKVLFSFFFKKGHFLNVSLSNKNFINKRYLGNCHQHITGYVTQMLLTCSTPHICALFFCFFPFHFPLWFCFSAQYVSQPSPR